MAPPHPLQILSVEEIKLARQIIIENHPKEVIDFREIYLHEPPKESLLKYLEAEHSGRLSVTTPRPARRATCQYDTIGTDRIPKFNESIADLDKRKCVENVVVSKQKHHAGLTLHEFRVLVEVCQASQQFKDAIAELNVPDHFEIVIEPWPYGGISDDEENERYFQGLIFAQDLRNGNADSNFYAYPLPLIPVMDSQKQEIVRIDRLATGGKGDAFDGKTHAPNVLDHCASAEYVPELLKTPIRTDLKPLNVVQPDGPSFTVKDDSLIEWQKWRFRVGFNPREGATIHDVWYNGRSIFYRLSVSEMTVPYADPRYPFVRKQAFDFGDGGAGHCANNLSLGCDCLGMIKYLDGVLATGSEGEPEVASNVVCVHEQDNGIAWKHTNWRTNRAVVTRNRELVVQFIITLANYEYVFAYKFNQSGDVIFETRATGIVSVVNIDKGKTAPWGNVVASGVLAQNHQHIFCVRVDPAIDGVKNSVVYEDSLPVPTNKKTNPYGNYYEVRQTLMESSQWLDASPESNRVIKMINPSIKNPISGKPVGYKFHPLPTTKLLADPNSLQAQRALFASHHLWVTKYKDDELFAAGRYTLQSREEIDGVADAVARSDAIVNEDVVLWSVFGLTHNPRVEDWPVMPAETHQIVFRPVDFFTENPSIDVPSNRNLTSTLVPDSCCSKPGDSKI